MMYAESPFLDAARPVLRMRPLKAFRHFQNLVADKEDTAEVFHISECLPSRRLMETARAFCASDHGQRLMAQEPSLPDLLDDHARLAAMPAGSVAHAYLAFMRAEGLSAAGLVAEHEKILTGRPRYHDQFQWFGNRIRDTHDLVHVLTGYGRDALGEQCALGFSSGQYHGLTDLFLAWAGAAEIKRRIRSGAPVFSAIREARRQGKAAARLYAQDVTALLAEPLEAARARMAIPAPVHYGVSHARFRAAGIDPYTFLSAT